MDFSHPNARIHTRTKYVCDEREGEREREREREREECICADFLVDLSGLVA